ncbi:Radical SAM domain protein [Prosthecochloris aestuarii DSM 271]|uniref:Radical SAM domain protein n=2 Tax=Prosthecochloris aestuarii TaxID=1102 RepID=B4S7X5_PROA2|nr:Radical SAM domain protein [Prosthecochloris aestuarii DSM 271]
MDLDETFRMYHLRKKEPMAEIHYRTTTFRMPEHIRYLGHNRNGRSVFFNPLAPDWIAVEDGVALALSLCDGHRNIEEITRIFEPGTSDKITIEPMMETLASAGWLEPATGDNHQPTSRQKMPGAPLSSLSLYVTASCNLSCRYCFYNAGHTDTPDVLKTQDILNLIDRITGSTVSNMVFLGGEPLLHDDIALIGRYALDRGIKSQLVTNGTLINEENSEEIAESFATIQISLDGLKKEHEVIRGKASFEPALRGMRLLLHKKSDIRVSCMVSRVNVHELDGFISFLFEEGVRHVHFTRLLMTGRGRSGTNHAISEKIFYELLAGLEATWGSVMHMDQYRALCDIVNKPKHICGIGNGTLEINHLGDIYPCYRFMDDESKLGNIRTDSPLSLYQDSDIIAKLRCETVEADVNCRDCQIRLLCGGGCLADRSEKLVDAVECDQKRSFWNNLILSS